MILVRFAGSNSLAAQAISAASYGFWAYHVDTILPGGEWVGAHVRGGVLKNHADYDRGDRTRQRFVALPAEEWTTARFYDFILRQVGKPYDLTAIAAFVTHRSWARDDAWFCSELVAAGLMECGLLAPIATRVNKITPRDLLLILSGINTGITELEALPQK